MKENCAECKHHDVFWGDSGCNLLNNGERCKFEPKVITNAQKIRAMSDEALAKMLTVPGGGVSCLKCLKTVEDECYMKCDEQCLEWLQKPAEGG